MSNILETFFILFDSDASKVKKGADEASAATKKLEGGIGAANQMAGKLGDSFLDVVKSSAGALAGILAVGSLAAGFMATVNAADALGEVSEALDVNVSELDAWGHAVKMSGGTADGFHASLKTLTASMAQMDAVGKSRVAPFFKELGVNMLDASGKMRPVMDMLPELADSFSKMGKDEAFGMGRKLGLDEGTIMLLQKGRVAVEDLVKRQKELGTISEEAAEAAGAFNDAIDDTAHSGRTMFAELGVVVLPVFTSIIRGVTSTTGFLREHGTFVAAFFATAAAVVSYLYVPAMIKATAVSLMPLMPLILVGAAIAAVAALFALAYDDITAFMEGGDSMIGEAAKKWPIIGDIVRSWVGYLVLLKDMALAVFRLVADLINDPVNAWSNFTTAMGAAFDRFANSSPTMIAMVKQIRDAFADMGQSVEAVWDAVAAAIRTAVGVVTGAIDTVSGAYGKVKGMLGLGGGGMPADTAAAIAKGQGEIATASSTPLASQTSSSIANTSRVANKSTSVQVGTVNVQTAATDSDGISKSIGDSLGAQMRQVADHHDDGVAY